MYVTIKRERAYRSSDFKRARTYRPRTIKRERAYHSRAFKRAKAYCSSDFKRARTYRPRTIKKARAYHSRAFKRAKAYRPRAVKRATAYCLGTIKKILPGAVSILGPYNPNPFNGNLAYARHPPSTSEIKHSKVAEIPSLETNGTNSLDKNFGLDPSSSDNQSLVTRPIAGEHLNIHKKSPGAKSTSPVLPPGGGIRKPSPDIRCFLRRSKRWTMNYHKQLHCDDRHPISDQEDLWNYGMMT
uniref:Uncharacterized protein n=1 Tax=Timema shepardi TaxID=629360 RepID=A0A7R9B1J4_TIMSH|nr:unnamed protein product [Timema shepardi]